jgi:hypothetical protein
MLQLLRLFQSLRLVLRFSDLSGLLVLELFGISGSLVRRSFGLLFGNVFGFHLFGGWGIVSTDGVRGYSVVPDISTFLVCQSFCFGLSYVLCLHLLRGWWQFISECCNKGSGGRIPSWWASCSASAFATCSASICFAAGYAIS